MRGAGGDASLSLAGRFCGTGRITQVSPHPGRTDFRGGRRQRNRLAVVLRVHDRRRQPPHPRPVHHGWRLGACVKRTRAQTTRHAKYSTPKTVLGRAWPFLCVASRGSRPRRRVVPGWRAASAMTGLRVRVPALRRCDGCARPALHAPTCQPISARYGREAEAVPRASAQRACSLSYTQRHRADFS